MSILYVLYFYDSYDLSSITEYFGRGMFRKPLETEEITGGLNVKPNRSSTEHGKQTAERPVKLATEVKKPTESVETKKSLPNVPATGLNPFGTPEESPEKESTNPFGEPSNEDDDYDNSLNPFS